MDNAGALSAVDAPSRATRREWLGLAVIALPCMLYAMDLTVLNLALPRIAADLKPSSATLLWIVDIYGPRIGGARLQRHVHRLASVPILAEAVETTQGRVDRAVGHLSVSRHVSAPSR